MVASEIPMNERGDEHDLVANATASGESVYGYVPEFCVLNLRRDLPDTRDWNLRSLLGSSEVALPSNDFHMRAIEPPIRGQSSLGSCTGFGSTRAHRVARKVAGFTDIELSPLFQYYNERFDMGTIAQDSGATIRGSIKALVAYGACLESLWPYVLANWQTKPPPTAYANALDDQALEYYTVNNDIQQIKQAINSGFVVTIGISVYSSFMSASSGEIPIPAQGEALQGGHNIVLDTYDDSISRFGFANSWSSGWGKQGFGTIPYQYIQNLGFDGWVIRKTESGGPAPAPQPPNPPPPNPPAPPAQQYADKVNIVIHYPNGKQQSLGGNLSGSV